MINREKLLEVLSKVKPGLSSKEIIEQSGDFVFSEGVVATYNDEISISHKLKEIDFVAVVPGVEFYSLLSKVVDEDVMLSLEENELVVKGRKFRASVRIQSEVTLPIDSLKHGRFSPLPTDFIEGVKFSIFSACKDMTKPALTCLYVNQSKIQSCDNYRLTEWKLDKAIGTSFLLPARAALELIKYPVIAYCCVDGWIHFKTADDCIFSCRTLEEEYPDLSSIINMGKSHKIKFPHDMKAMLDRSMVALEEEGQVKVEVGEGKIEIKVEGNVLRYEETARVRSDDSVGNKRFVFSINPKHLVEILQSMTEAVISDDALKLKFMSNKYIHVMALTEVE